MKAEQWFRCRAVRALQAVVVSLVAAAAMGTRADAAGGWRPPAPAPDDFDWVQLTSGEWLRGELIAMYDRSLEFDSEEFDRQTLDWEDVRLIRTANIVQVAFIDGTVAVGELRLDGDAVLVIGDDEHASTRTEILSITPGVQSRLDQWSADIGAGFNTRSGNTSQTEANAQVSVKRRRPRDRLGLDYLGNLSETDGVTTADNQRASLSWDLFTSARFFVTPVAGEYYRDPFQNVSARWTLGSGVGYQLVDTAKVEWDVAVGLGYQRTTFEEVAAGEAEAEETPAFFASTRYDNEVRSWLDIFFDFQFFLVNAASGSYTHQLWTGLEFDLVGDLDLEISWVWDRIQDPQPGADGVLPQQDDYRTIFALEYSF